MPLNAYQEPDTSMEPELRLQPGTYEVLGERRDRPKETMYHRVAAFAHQGREFWICTRWRDRHYAQVETIELPAPPEDAALTGDGFSVPESKLIDLLPHFANYTYGHDHVSYPYSLPGVRVPVGEPRRINCCTFVEALLVKAWADTHPSFSWSRARHNQMMIRSTDDYYSPVTAAVESDMAIAAAHPFQQPRPWSIVQGWRHRWREGHTFLIVAHDTLTDRVLTLESNSAYNISGVGFRGIGDLSARPPESWWELPNVWTWTRIRRTYQHRRVGYLRVTDRSWAPSRA